MKTPLRSLAGGALALLLLASTAIPALAVTFSISPGGATPATPDAILSDPGAMAPALAVIVIPTAAGNTDAFTYGHFGPVDGSRIFFSVDPASTGAMGTAVASEAAGAGAPGPGDQPADVFITMGMGMNALAWDGNGLANPGMAPNLGLIEPISAGAFDNIDGLDMRAASPLSPIYWSVDPGTIAGSAPYAGLSPADIYLGSATPGYSGAPGIYASEMMLGLVPGDDIDALEIIEDGAAGFTAGDTILFSLTPGSPTLTTLGFALGTGGASILGVGMGIGAMPMVVVPDFGLGLLPTDNIDAIAIVPEPGRALLLSLGLLAMAARRRRRQ